MLIWILAFLLFGAFALAGYTLGAVRLAATLVGLLVAACLSSPLGGIFTPILKLVGVSNPFILWIAGPPIAFLLILIIFSIIGAVLNRQVGIYYKYKAGDLQNGLWARLNPRLGLCLGLWNAAIYLILLVRVIFPFSYATTQLVTPETAPQETFSMKVLNSAGAGLESSGMAKVATSMNTLPESYYQAADIVGLVYHNDLLEGRLSRYPTMLALAQMPQFQDIANDKDFTELRQKQPPISEILSYPKTQAILNDPEVLKKVWNMLAPNLGDLTEYLKTGVSAKFDSEKILGVWDFDIAGSIRAVKQSKPTISYQEMSRTKQIIRLIFDKTTLTATPEPDKQVFLKDFGKLQAAAKPNQIPTVSLQSYSGQWTSDGSKYELTFPDKGGTLEGEIDGDKLTITGDVYPLVFTREF